MEGIYHLTALAGAEERMVVPPFLREQVVELGIDTQAFQEERGAGLPVLAETGVVMPIYALFADILDYPERSIAKSLGDCIGELTPAIPEALAHLKDFQNTIADKSLGNSRKSTRTPSICAPIARQILDITYSAMTAGGAFFWRS